MNGYRYSYLDVVEEEDAAYHTMLCTRYGVLVPLGLWDMMPSETRISKHRAQYIALSLLTQLAPVLE